MSVIWHHFEASNHFLLCHAILLTADTGTVCAQQYLVPRLNVAYQLFETVAIDDAQQTQIFGHKIGY